MAATSDGTVFESRGKWVARITRRGKSGKPRRIQLTGKSKKHALILLSELRAQHPRHQLLDEPSTVTVADYLESWLRTVVRPHRAETTIDNYERTLRLHVVPHLGTTRLSDLTPLAVREWLSLLEVGDRTRENCYAILHAAMGDAVRMQAIASNPCEPVERPKVTPEEIFPFTILETQKLLNGIAEHRLAPVVHLAVRLGMRQGELFGLRWEDVDDDHIHIRQQAVEVAGRAVIRPPKNKASIRTLPLDGALRGWLDSRRADAMREGFAASEYVFLSRSGTLLRRSSFRKWPWAALLKRLDIEHRGFHHCRHTFATHALAAGESLANVSAMLGHSNVEVTSRVYIHAVPGESRGVVERFGRLLGG